MLSKFNQAGFFIFGLVFASHDFEVVTVRLLRRVDRQSRTGLIYLAKGRIADLSPLAAADGFV